MDQAIHNKIVSFVRGIADDVLHDLFKRGKYPDVSDIGDEIDANNEIEPEDEALPV